jgi:hypothetical protein
MFYDRASHLDEFCFRRKRIERKHVEYARDSYHDEFFDVPPQFYSHIPPCFYSCASPRTFLRALSQFAQGPNHRSYSFGPQENRFEPKHFVMAHVLTMMIVSHVGLLFPLEGPFPTLSRDTWMVHAFSVVAHVSLGQVVRCKGL